MATTTSPCTLATVLDEMRQAGEIDSYERDPLGVLTWGPKRFRPKLLTLAQSHGYSCEPLEDGQVLLVHPDPDEPSVQAVFRNEPLQVAQYLAYTLRRCMSSDGENLLAGLLDSAEAVLLVNDKRVQMPGRSLSTYVCSSLYHEYREELDAGARELDVVDEILATLIGDVGVPEYLLEESQYLLPADLSPYTKLLPVASALARDTSEYGNDVG